MKDGLHDSQQNAPRLLSSRTLHLCALSSFAVTAPILNILIDRTAYLHDQQVGLPQVAVLLMVLSVFIPGCWLLADLIVFYVSRRLGGRGRDTILFLLAGIICLTAVRPYVIAYQLNQAGLSGIVALLVSGIAAFLFVVLYRRVPAFRTWITVSSVGILMFPLVFVWQFEQLQKAGANLTGISADRLVPVVVVVFDEFSGATLLTDAQQINAKRFPNFARLADQSTFYRNATTVHVRTDIAVPAIVSGRYPTTTDHSPTAGELPGNLFQVIKSSDQFEMAVFEPITRICPPFPLTTTIPELSEYQRTTELLYTLYAVYPRLVFTNDVPIPLPKIPMKWFGIGNLIYPKRADWAKLTEGLFNYSGNLNRADQMNHFLQCLTPGTKTRFAFLHLVFPHVPWSFYPSGEMYQSEAEFDRCPAGATGELGEDWLDDPATILRNQYRYELQVGFADQFIGRLLDRLKETDQLEKCLLVVMADHGVSFREKHSRRLPDAEILPDIASIPLFIKFPGQTEGKVDDRNVQSIDVYPTIAEVLDLTLPEPVDGISVTQEMRSPRKTIHFNRTSTVVEPDFPNFTQSVKREWELFGQLEIDELPAKASSHPDWIGRSISQFEISGTPIPATATYSSKFVAGVILESELSESPADLVVAFDGVIQATGTTYWKQHRIQGFEFLIPRNQAGSSIPKIDVFVYDRASNRLRPIEPVKLQ